MKNAEYVIEYTEKRKIKKNAKHWDNYNRLFG